jgi:hypothetical protein
MTAVAAIVVIGLVVGLYAVLHDSSPKAQAGCIEVPAAHSVGGASYQVCGDRAGRWCRSAANRDDWLGSAVRDRCRRAGYP